MATHYEQCRVESFLSKPELLMLCGSFENSITMLSYELIIGVERKSFLARYTS